MIINNRLYKLTESCSGPMRPGRRVKCWKHIQAAGTIVEIKKWRSSLTRKVWESYIIKLDEDGEHVKSVSSSCKTPEGYIKFAPRIVWPMEMTYEEWDEGNGNAHT